METYEGNHNQLNMYGLTSNMPGFWSWSTLQEVVLVMFYFIRINLYSIIATGSNACFCVFLGAWCRFDEQDGEMPATTSSKVRPS